MEHQKSILAIEECSISPSISNQFFMYFINCSKVALCSTLSLYSIAVKELFATSKVSRHKLIENEPFYLLQPLYTIVRTLHRTNKLHITERFNVNLVCGSNFDSDDVAFHFDVRFNYGLSQCSVVRNSRTCGHWGTEEVCAPCFPFNVNVPFEMRLCTKSEKLKIYINNSHFIDFKYRLPVQRVTFLHIQGDLNLTQVVL
ncbi:galectin-7 [Biomphalaria pfeifferi]|uniref:Galectin n=1 Tax=Biomphalaria pfeifferi TaxID=112525 RepID=A0AAD8CD38_BIOPF|nr:galectin-7 [Biomphalaria pfeifferi]